MKRAALAAITVLLAGRLLFGPFRQGWSGMRTDFPNHYVAAILTLRREPLRQFYDWEWFQRQIQYAGIDRQLGGYVPYPPLVMLPLLPLAKLPPLKAKQTWMVLELVFLAAGVWLLARLTRLGILEVSVLALLAYVSLATNLVLGQYYVFLFLLLSCATFFLLRGREFTAGAVFGLIFSLKLYAAPFLLFFAARRQWRAFWGMVASIAALGMATIAWFGWDAVWFYATSVMTRGMDGSIVDPYDPGLGSMAVLLRRLFVPEAELNPHPLMNAPAAFFFLQTFYTLAVLAVTLLALPSRSSSGAPAAAWFIIVLFALSPVTAASHFVMLLVPVAVLVSGARWQWAAGLIALYVLVQLPLRPWNAWLFPKLWFSLAMSIYTGWQFRPNIRLRPALIILTLAAALSGLIAWARWNEYRLEPPQTAEHLALRPGALFSSAPAVSQGGVIYESMEEEFFGLRSDGRRFLFEGEAFHPSVPASGSPVYFELVSHGHSHIAVLDRQPLDAEDAQSEPAVSPDNASLAFISRGSLIARGKLLVQGDASDPAFFPDGRRIAFAHGFPGRRLICAIAVEGGETQTLIEGGDNFEPAVSPDGSSLAYVHQDRGARQVWVRSLKTGARRRLTTGACNNDWPAWDLDSRSIVFASDCSRGYGLPALYRIPAR